MGSVKKLRNEDQRRLWLGDKPSRKVKANVVYQGDNLPLMKELEGGKIDLIYIDPPFCSQAVYKSKAFNEIMADFNDQWGGYPIIHSLAQAKASRVSEAFE